MFNNYQQQEQAYPQQEQVTYTNRMAGTGDTGAQRSQWGRVYSREDMFPPTLPHNDVRVAAALTYSLGWFSGLLFALFSRHSRYVRFHALQSLIFFGGINLIDMSVPFIGRYGIGQYMPFARVFGVFFLLFIMLLNVVAVIGWVVGITQAYRGSYYRLPVVGDIVAGILGLGADVKP